jgi:hypothetical protein
MSIIDFRSLQRDFFKNKELLFTAPSSIVEYLSDMDKVYVLVNSDELSSDRNVFCYCLDGKLLWQVEEMYKLHDRNYFTSIYFQDNELYSYNRNGVEARIDRITGKYLKTEFIK